MSAAADDHVVELDMGTWDFKAVPLSAGGDLIAEATAALEVSRPHALWSEQAPADWLKAVDHAMLALREQAGPSPWSQVR